MIWDEYKPTLEIGTRQIVFLSYYHWGDEHYRKRFEMSFIHAFVPKFLEPGEVEASSPEEYVQELIDRRYITASTVVVILIGPSTWGRKHIDWEIAAALTEKDGTVSGLLGILLPEYELAEDGKFRLDTIPPRLADNVKSGFAQIYTWNSVCSEDAKIKTVVQKAFDNRVTLADKADNSRSLMESDLCE